jgi:Ni,Fe-hydrogenase III small subunit
MFRLLWKTLRTGVITESPSKIRDFNLENFEVVGENIKKLVDELYGGRALRIRHVDAGSTNAEELELTALGNPYYDIERFGLSFTASPRHADILTVSGPVTRNMEHALKTAYEMTPEPKIVIAVGDAAITGGIWNGSYAVVGPVEAVIPVDAKIPGDPPSPLAIMKGLLTALEAAKEKKHA